MSCNIIIFKDKLFNKSFDLNNENNESIRLNSKKNMFSNENAHNTNNNYFMNNSQQDKNMMTTSEIDKAILEREQKLNLIEVKKSLNLEIKNKSKRILKNSDMSYFKSI